MPLSVNNSSKEQSNKYSKQFARLKGWAEYFPSVTPLLNEIEEKVNTISPPDLVLPPPHLVFNAFKFTDYNDVAVVIVGQDPYHQTFEVEGNIIAQAMGLSFSVPKGVKIPPSLRNIYKELARNFNDFTIPEHGDLSSWADNILLLNSALTVEHSKPTSHAKTGWTIFTNLVIQALVKREQPIVFLSWGKHAHKMTHCAENTHHFVIKTSHPSPLGATKSGADFDAFLGSGCFAKANDYLVQQRRNIINWQP